MNNLKSNQETTSEEIQELEQATGGKISTYEWWDLKDGTRVFVEPENKEDVVFTGELGQSFFSQKGVYIGSMQQARWYKKHKLKVYEPYPIGIAERYDEQGNLEGYVGYTHRGAQTFKIGDRLFDEKYIPVPEDYTPEEWTGWVQEFDRILKEAEAEGDEWWINDIKNDGISRVIPFRMRGNKVIRTLEEAAIAARNMSDYLS